VSRKRRPVSCRIIASPVLLIRKALIGTFSRQPPGPSSLPSQSKPTAQPAKSCNRAWNPARRFSPTFSHPSFPSIFSSNPYPKPDRLKKDAVGETLAWEGRSARGGPIPIANYGHSGDIPPALSISSEHSRANGVTAHPKNCGFNSIVVVGPSPHHSVIAR